jgi:hypothetical protein
MVRGNPDRTHSLLYFLEGEKREFEGLSRHNLSEYPNENYFEHYPFYDLLNSINIPSLIFTNHFLVDQSSKTPSKRGFGRLV